MIPAGLYDPKRADALLRYLITELRRCMSDRATLEAKWIRWAESYRAQPEEAVKNFPFEGAANLVMPVIATDVDTMFARILGMLLEGDRIWSTEPKRPEFVVAAPKLEEFLAWAQENELHLYEPLADWVLEVCKLGTGVLKQRYTREQRKVFEWRELEQGVFQQQSLLMMKDAPSVHHVKLNDFFVPAGYADIQQAPWCAERISLNWSQFTNRVRAGVYQQPPRTGEWWARQNRGAVQQELDRISMYQASYSQFLNLYEFWVDFDIDGDGYDEALVCTVHLDSEDYVRLDFNPFFNQDKPYSSSRFIRDGNSFYGIGLCEMGDDFQEEITTMHNQRLDNATIANTVALACESGETSVENGTPIYPGVVLKLNNPKALQPIQFGQKYDSTINNERESLSYLSRRNGVNDYITGTNSPDIGYGTAYTTSQMIQASTKRFGITLREIRNALSETGTRVLELYQQYNQHGKEFFALGPVDGTMVHMVLQFPLDLIRKGLKVGVVAMDPASSKDSRIQKNMQLMQMLMQFYQQYMQGLGYAMNPQMPPLVKQVAVQMLQGASTLMRRTLDDFDLQDSDALIPELGSALQVQQQQLQQLQSVLLGNGGAPSSVGGPPQIGGMGGPPGLGTGTPGPSLFQPSQSGFAGGPLQGAGQNLGY